MATSPAPADHNAENAPKTHFWNRPWFWIWTFVVLFVLCGLGFEAFQGYNFPCGFNGGKLGSGYNLCSRVPTSAERTAGALRNMRDGACCGVICIFGVTAAFHFLWAAYGRPWLKNQRAAAASPENPRSTDLTEQTD